MRSAFALLLISSLTPACRDPAPVAAASPTGAPPATAPGDALRAWRPPGCGVLLGAYSMSEIWGAGRFYTDSIDDGTFLFQCEWRAPGGDATAPRVVSFQAACGRRGRQLGRLHWPGEGARTLATVGHVGRARRRADGTGVDVVFESGRTRGCWAQLAATGSMERALPLARAMDAAIGRMAARR